MTKTPNYEEARTRLAVDANYAACVLGNVIDKINAGENLNSNDKEFAARARAALLKCKFGADQNDIEGARNAFVKLLDFVMEAAAAREN